MILGQGWASQGFSAAKVDSGSRGVGLLLHEGGLAIDMWLKSYYLSYADVAALDRQAELLPGFGVVPTRWLCPPEVRQLVAGG